MQLDGIKENRLYDDLAYLWLLVSHPDDYEEEACYWRDAVRDKLGSGRHRILELGVGGGNNLSHLTSDFEATAVDLSASMLEECRKVNPEVELIQGDMRSVRLGCEFDAVLIHDAISCMRTEDDLRATFATAAVHLRQGGIFVTSPDYTSESFTNGRIRHSTTSNETTELTHIEYEFDPDPSDSTYETLMVYLIREKGQMRVELDRHILGLFPHAIWIDLMAACGFSVEARRYDVHPDDRQSSLYVGVKL